MIGVELERKEFTTILHIDGERIGSYRDDEQAMRAAHRILTRAVELHRRLEDSRYTTYR